MAKRSNHALAFKAGLALAALDGHKTIAGLGATCGVRRTLIPHGRKRVRRLMRLLRLMSMVHIPQKVVRRQPAGPDARHGARVCQRKPLEGGDDGSTGACRAILTRRHRAMDAAGAV